MVYRANPVAFFALLLTSSPFRCFFDSSTNAKSSLFAQAHQACGTEDPSLDDFLLDQAKLWRIEHGRTKYGDRYLQLADSCEELCKQCINISVYFHYLVLPFDNDVDGTDFVIPNPTSSFNRFMSDDPTVVAADFTSMEMLEGLIADTMETVNERFADTPFTFTHAQLKNPSIGRNSLWALYPLQFRNSIWNSLAVNGSANLNVYLSPLICDLFDFPECQFRAGLSAFPSWQSRFPNFDGILLRYDNLVGGGYLGHDEGITLVHELGHWLGLYHTFMNLDEEKDPCDPSNPNDLIDDTPQHSGPTHETQPDCFLSLVGDVPDTCPNLPGADPVHNYMNYISHDFCLGEGLGEFTCDQVLRMYKQWHLYRSDDLRCADDEYEIEIVGQLDLLYHAIENRILLQNSKGESIFDSDVDYDKVELTGYLAMGLCVPKGEYTFQVLDSYGDGFTDPSANIEVFLDGFVVAKISGNFGTESTVLLGEKVSETAAPPTLSPTTTAAPVVSVPKDVYEATYLGSFQRFVLGTCTPVLPRILVECESGQIDILETNDETIECANIDSQRAVCVTSCGTDDSECWNVFQSTDPVQQLEGPFGEVRFRCTSSEPSGLSAQFSYLESTTLIECEYGWGAPVALFRYSMLGIECPGSDDDTAVEYSNDYLTCMYDDSDREEEALLFGDRRSCGRGRNCQADECAFYFYLSVTALINATALPSRCVKSNVTTTTTAPTSQIPATSVPSKAPTQPPTSPDDNNNDWTQFPYTVCPDNDPCTIGTTTGAALFFTFFGCMEVCVTAEFMANFYLGFGWACGGCP